MKKRQTTFFGFAVLMIAAIFTITACPGDTGGGDIPVKLRAYDNSTSASQSLATNRAVGMESGGPVFALSAADTTFSAYTDFYATKLGDWKKDITPTKFALYGDIMLFSPGGEMMNVGQGLFDYAEGITIDIGEVPGGVTCAAMEMDINTSEVGVEGVGSLYPVIEFEWPNSEQDFKDHPYYGNADWGSSWNNNKIVSMSPSLLELSTVKVMISDTSEPELFGLRHIIYGAGPLRMYNGEPVPTNSVIPGLDSLEGGVQFGPSGGSIVVPFTPEHVPEDASSVTLNVSWNLDGIVSQYEGETDAASDDIFILKDGWWNGLQMTASVR